jgi:Reverse transcriptase (RNA-dependent DNA polymerase)
MCYETYIPKVIYFGMCNAPAFFQRIMQKDFVPFLEQYRENADQYMDDWWIATSDDEEERALHVQAIHNFLATCEKNSSFLKPSKCEIMQPQIMLLEWLVKGKGLCIDLSKVTGIFEWLRVLCNPSESIWDRLRGHMAYISQYLIMSDKVESLECLRRGEEPSYVFRGGVALRQRG